MTEHSDILGYSIANFGKEKNGDSFLFEYLDEEGLLIAVVADGVSQQPCDWLASLTTCRTVIDQFKKNKEQKELSKRLWESIAYTSKFVASTEGKCHKMAATLSIVVCQQSSEEFFYANIGDSRIYSLYNGTLKQLTTDDVTIRKERILTPAGTRVIDRPILTKVIGQDNIAFNINRSTIRTGEALILETDGFYDARKATFNNIMLEFGDAEDFKAGFAALTSKLEILRGDDLTAIALKRK